MAKVKIRNSQTGEVREVEDSQLGDFGLSSPTPTAPVAQAPVAPVVQAPVQQPIAPTPQKSLSENIGQGALDLLANLVKPYTDSIKKTTEQNAKLPSSKGDLVQSIKNAGQATANLAGNTIGNLPFVANTASFAVPFGKAGFVGSKFLAPGAAVGALQGVGSGDNPKELVGDAILGAGTAGLAQGAGKLVKGVSKVGSKVEDLGNKARGGVSKIRVKPSVYGASKEEQITQTLNDLKISGTAAQKYAQLQPKMTDLGDQIYEKLNTNPKVIPLENIRRDFKTNLSEELRAKTLNSKNAEKEIDGYIEDLYNNGIPGKVVPEAIATPELFKLKQTINGDYQRVAKKLQTGEPLNDREKIMAVARKTIDDVLAEAHPDVKKLTRQQSNLYDAAPSLSAQRDATPTLRIAGTTIPTGAVQKVQDTAGSGLQNVGRALEAPGQLPTIPATPLGQVASRLPVGYQPTNPQEQQPNAENYNVGSDQSHTLPIIADTQSAPAQTDYVTGRSPSEHAQAYIAALQAGDKAAASQIKGLYDMEINYQKQNKPAKEKALSAQQIKDVNLANNGLRGLDIIKKETGYDEKTGKVGMNAVNMFTQLRLSPFNLGNRRLYKALFDAAGARLRIESGAALSPDEIKRYVDQYIGQLGDDPNALNYEISQLDDFLNGIKNQKSDVPDINIQAPDSSGYLPAIQ